MNWTGSWTQDQRFVIQFRGRIHAYSWRIHEPISKSYFKVSQNNLITSKKWWRLNIRKRSSIHLFFSRVLCFQVPFQKSRLSGRDRWTNRIVTRIFGWNDKKTSFEFIQRWTPQLTGETNEIRQEISLPPRERKKTVKESQKFEFQIEYLAQAKIKNWIKCLCDFQNI